MTVFRKGNMVEIRDYFGIWGIFIIFQKQN